MTASGSAPSQGSQPAPKVAEPSGSDSGTGTSTPRPAAPEAEEKKKKRSLFGFGKKRAEESTKPSSKEAAKPTSNKPPSALAQTTATTNRSAATSSAQPEHPYFSPSSPGRPGFPSSPRISSPASSQIFERDVQETGSILIPNSPAIPSHIQTENYIPPVLDASSEAITDNHLDPDNVEIITHASHQPIGVGLAAATSSALSSPHEPPAHSSWTDELAAFSARRYPADSASNYGSLADTTDVRRLSFISFADVVQAEQQQLREQLSGGEPGSRESTHLIAGLTSLNINSSSSPRNRSPSPVRSPVSSAGSKSGSVTGVDLSPRLHPTVPAAAGKQSLGSPTNLGPGGSGPPPVPVVTGEIAVETMAQALRRTGSGDLSGYPHVASVRSFPMSPI